MNNDAIAAAAEHIRAGGLVAFPTETVWGLGANALDAAAVARIYEAKQRPRTSPLIVHVADVAAARDVVSEWPDLAGALAEAFWPGPLTLVLPKAASIPDIVSAGLDTVGVRVPNHEVAQALLRAAKVPIAAPSANRFTELSPTRRDHVLRGLSIEPDFVLEGNVPEVGIESTVVRVHPDFLELLRPGIIDRAVLSQFAPVQTPEQALEQRSPGLHEKHYRPRTPLLLVDSAEQVPAGSVYIFHTGALTSNSIGLPHDPQGYARHLYAALHRADAEGVQCIAVQNVPEGPEWDGVRDRLQRAQS